MASRASNKRILLCGTAAQGYAETHYYSLWVMNYAYNNPVSFNDSMGLEAEASPSVVPSTTSGAAPVANEVKAEVKSDDLPDAPMLEPIKEMPTLASAGPNVEMTLEKMPVPEQSAGSDGNDDGNASGAIGEENSIEHQLNAAKSWGNGGGKGAYGETQYKTDGKPKSDALYFRKRKDT